MYIYVYIYTHIHTYHLFIVVILIGYLSLFFCLAPDVAPQHGREGVVGEPTSCHVVL